ncbi:reverse transcriptase domain-containing protein [Tanacetum coccineum]
MDLWKKSNNPQLWEQYPALTQGNQEPGVVKPEIGRNVNFEIKSQFMRELREDTFSGNKNDDAHEHVERPLNDGWTDFHQEPSIPVISLKSPLSKGIAHRPKLLSSLKKSKTSSKKHDGSSSRNVDNSSNPEGISAIVSKLDSLGRDMKKLKENMHAIQVGCQICGGSHLDKECPLNKKVKSVEEVRYGEFSRPYPNNSRNDDRFNRGAAGYNQPLAGEKRTSLTKIINKFIEETARRHTKQDQWLKKFYQNTKTNRDAHDKIIQGLKTKVKTLANKVEGRADDRKFKECRSIYVADGSSLYTPFYYSPEGIEYYSANSGFSNIKEPEIDQSGMAEALAILEATLECKKVVQKENKNVSFYVDPYEPPIPFPRRLEYHAEEALVHQTMESLKKIKINRPLLKEIRKTDNYTKHMKDLNQLPPKEQDPRSFILPCSIGRLDFNNALADLGANISIMPLSMYKHLGIGKLEPINMVIKMADNTKCTPKGIVENLLVKIDKFIFLVDFVILDMVEDFRMPIILGIPLLATTHSTVDMFGKCISLENIGRGLHNGDVPINEDKRYYECNNDNKWEELEWDELSLNDWMRIRYGKICKMTRDRILQDYWKNRFGNEEDSEENSEDPEECREDRNNAILGSIHDKLDDDWFRGTSEDEDDLDGILDYLEPSSYDGFIDLDNEAYKKIKVLGIKEIPRTQDNVAALRARLMEKAAKEGDGQ